MKNMRKDPKTRPKIKGSGTVGKGLTQLPILLNLTMSKNIITYTHR